MRTDYQRLTDLGELGIGLHAGDANGNIDRYSRTATYRVTVGSGHSDPLWRGVRSGQFFEPLH
jgi:hypothetical protein